VPYNNRAIKPYVPSMRSNTNVTSARFSTVGKRCGFFARTTSSSQGNSTPSTSRYRNNSAESA